MATSHHRKRSADKMSNEQAAHHHDDEAKTKTNHSILWPSRVATWPFRFIRQTLSDYQSGRNMRKRRTQEPEPGAGDDQRWEPEDETNKQQDGHETTASVTRGSSPRYDKPPQKNEQHRSARSEDVEHWVHQAGEWPWSIGYVVDQDSSRNYRVLSVLELSDLCYSTMQSQRTVWDKSEIEADELTGRVEERDELMEYLTRP
ncbi:hypothetical protein F4782DRAFT_513091 [Xylaria castorea]|nr:hypothetical protein F4782DRAFT_513091 [Xylaria castorea]